MCRFWLRLHDGMGEVAEYSLATILSGRWSVGALCVPMAVANHCKFTVAVESSSMPAYGGKMFDWPAAVVNE
jgi:hypothetical protein